MTSQLIYEIDVYNVEIYEGFSLEVEIINTDKVIGDNLS